MREMNSYQVAYIQEQNSLNLLLIQLYVVIYRDTGYRTNE